MIPTTDITMQKPGLETEVDLKNSHRSPRWRKTAAIIGTIAILLAISAIAAVITLVQAKKARNPNVITLDEIVETNVTYHLPLLNLTIEEKVVVTNDEEEIATPNHRTIYDYNKGYAVTRFENATDSDVCFIREFTPREDIVVKKAMVKTGKRDAVFAGELTKETYIIADEPFDRNLLSERASAMCENRRLVFVVKDSDIEGEPGSAIRKKRSDFMTVCEEECSGFTMEVVFGSGDECLIERYIEVCETCIKICYPICE